MAGRRKKVSAPEDQKAGRILTVRQKSGCIAMQPLFLKGIMTFFLLKISYCRKPFLQVSNDIIYMLGSDGQTDRVRPDSLIQQLLFGKL